MAISLRDIDTICETVTTTLGYNHLKEEQRIVINNFLLGNDVFVILPTGLAKRFVMLVCQMYSIDSWELITL